MQSRVALFLIAVFGAATVRAAVPAGAGDLKFSWGAFGFAYAFLIATLVLGGALYAFCRWRLVLTPRVVTRRYSAAIVVLTTFYLVATLLENEVVGPDATRLPYEAVPQALLLLMIHFRSYKTRQPAAILLALSSAVATLILGGLVFALGQADVRLGQSVAGVATAILIVYTVAKSTTTKAAYLKRRALSTVEDYGEPPDVPTPPYYLSLVQWIVLVVASLLAAVLARLTEGDSPSSLLAVEVLKYALIVIGVTALTAFAAAFLYWLIRRKRMPDFSWIVWIVWSLTAFAMLYSIYLLEAVH